ncbi:MAG: response regulator transcription factor [Kiritimatiellae bacterium]|nr:response regulator transcription factor [Kiritimatiellia bacterium]
MPHELLIVDDERAIREGLKRLLSAEGFSVRTAKDGDDALAAFRERRPSLVLLDVMMPKRNGFSVCGEIRSIDPITPIVFLTAKDGEAEQVRGFGLGADDYISKSAGDAELLARVRRAVERAAAYDRRAEAPESRRREIGSAIVDFDTLVVQNETGTERLTKTEADLLWLLVVERGKSVPSDEMVEVLKAGGFTGDSSSIYVHVSHLKKKLGRSGSLLCSERNIGYRLMR